ncbi:choline transporter [Tetragenococcus halophilus subsp. flandriensis]|uniref:BCCT family transporter n=1 Tax=Tetragenococcus halophilus TaxID=51669 RepID=UPI0023E9C458|nr:BCCT family transporter [Tetragenococcus halophilus]GMA08322.1 choline transporter [Tetragenococcus halophilus subsp. flandriensis]
MSEKKARHSQKREKDTQSKRKRNPELESERELARKLRKEEARARREAIENRPPFKGLQINPTTSLFDEEGKEEIGERNWKGWGIDIHPQVTIPATIILLLFIILLSLFSQEANVVFDYILDAVTNYTGWFMILATAIFIGAGIFFAFSRYGKIVIGGNDAKPEFSRWGWFAMLLSAGMGIGLVFWSVAEPISHLGEPSPMFNVDPNSPGAVQSALTSTFFHWGIHPWAIYAIVGLGLAFFSYNKGLPLTIRSLFYPLIGNKIYGWWGNIIDILSVLATMTGLATSLGLGVSQINAGLNHLFDVTISPTVQIILIIVITVFATTSVVLGLDKGVQKLSEINMALAAVFALFILLVGPTVFILSSFTQNLGYYAANFIEMSLWTETFTNTNWQGSWTLFYWAWWISWSPFVGMFIARISKGRSVKEFIIGVVLVPTIISAIFMSILGGTALYQQINGISDLASVVNVDESLALFSLSDNLPLSSVLSVVGIILVTVFFVTSSDSGSLVIDHLTSGGKLDTPLAQRIFWAVIEGAVAAVLLIGGGLTALQTASIITGLPFTFVLLAMVYSLYLGLRQEFLIERAVREKLRKVRNDHIISEVVQSNVEDKALVENVAEKLAEDEDSEEDTEENTNEETNEDNYNPESQSSQ